MTFFEKVQVQTKELPSKASMGAKILRLNKEIHAQQRILNEIYRELGERVFADEAFAQLEGADVIKQRITDCKDRMRVRSEEIEDLKELIAGTRTDSNQFEL